MAYNSTIENIIETSENENEYSFGFLPIMAYDRVRSCATRSQTEQLVRIVLFKDVVHQLTCSSNSGIGQVVCDWVREVQGEESIPMREEMLSKLNVTRGDVSLLKQGGMAYVTALASLHGAQKIYAFIREDKVECWVLVSEKTYEISMEATKLGLRLEQEHPDCLLECIVIEPSQLSVENMPKPDLELDVKRG